METIEFDKQPIEKALEDWGAEITGINTLLGCCELLAGLAEEATELAQAALKMRRTLDKSNPTPMTTGDASRNLNEEFADVLLCAAVLGLTARRSRVSFGRKLLGGAPDWRRAAIMFEYLPERPLEPPEEKPIAYCDYCGGEIYEGETVYNIDGQLIHEDCLHDFADDYFKDCKEEAVSYCRGVLLTSRRTSPHTLLGPLGTRALRATRLRCSMTT